MTLYSEPKELTDDEIVDLWLEQPVNSGSRDTLKAFLDFRNKMKQESRPDFAICRLILPSVADQQHRLRMKHETRFFMDDRPFLVRGWDWRYHVGEKDAVLHLEMHEYRILTAEHPEAEALIASTTKNYRKQFQGIAGAATQSKSGG